MAEHNVLPFEELHKARFEAGTAANLPPVPEGVGDTYWASDTQQLYIANADASGWVVGSGANSLSQLSDVDDSLAPTDGNSLYFDPNTSLWKASAGNLNLLSTVTMTLATANPSISSIIAMGNFRYFMIDFALRFQSGTGTARANRVVPLVINGGTAINTGMYQEWSDLGNNAGTALLSEALLSSNDNAAYTSPNSIKSNGRIWVYSRQNGAIVLDCLSLLMSTAGTIYHRLQTQYYFQNTSLDSIQFTGTFDSSSYIRLYGHRF